MIREENNIFELSTKKTSYIFQVTETGHLEKLHYGEKLETCDGISLKDVACVLAERFQFPSGYTISYDQEHMKVALENMCLEMSSIGKGDIREPFVSFVSEDGCSTSDFVFETYIIDNKKEELVDMPSSYSEDGEIEHLAITLKDRNSDVKLILNYYVFEDCDVICKSSKLVNGKAGKIRLKRLMSNQLDFKDGDYMFTTFNGAWAREMHRYDRKITPGKYVNSSVSGTSSSRANPFAMLWKEDATEDSGMVYGLNLIYSGNHYECAEMGAFGKVRFVSGINPETFETVLAPEESFESPEAVMIFSPDGFNGMSQNMHKFVRNHIVRGEYKFKDRPVLLNSWESAYFDIDEGKLLKLAKAGKEIGIELFVMDDGWFGNRNDDTSSLGDWYFNKKKLPKGVAGLAKKINDLGMDFGIWVEPEMANVNSDLYKAHPDWTIDIPDKNHSEGRNQRILDFANEEVCDYIIDAMTKLFESAPISYVKWDMNRNFSDYYSKHLPVDKKGETNHKYVQGLYKVMKALTERFPKILFEGCAGGGNRFDLGILSYMPQIWASDDTDARERIEIQTGYSYGYPMSTVTAHVSSCPNHQTLRNTPLETRFDVAAFGILGYECNLCDLKKEELEAMKEQISFYKQHRRTLQFGDYYRVKNAVNDFNNRGMYQWNVVSQDKAEALAAYFISEVIPNNTRRHLDVKGLGEDKKYILSNRKIDNSIKLFGDLINTVAPIHVRPDSFIQNTISKFVKMPGEQEEIKATGKIFNKVGAELSPGYAGTGFDDKTAYFQDFSSRLYLFKECE